MMLSVSMISPAVIKKICRRCRVNINLADLEAVDSFFVMKSRIMSIILPLMPPRG
ncbi:MAG: hypothetical protein ACLSE6_08380 [Alphaproteobacteria bacterium]